MKNKMKKTLAFLLAFVMVFTLVGVQMPVLVEAVTKMTLSCTKKTVAVGGMYTLAVQGVTDKKATYAWTSSDKDVAKVSKKGVVTGVDEGNATIQCKVTLSDKSTKTLSCKVTVKEQKAATSVKINNAKLNENKVHTIVVGESYDFNRTLSPAKSNDKTYWYILDEEYAEVNSGGVVTAKKAGITKLVAKVGIDRVSAEEATNKVVDSICLNIVPELPKLDYYTMDNWANAEIGQKIYFGSYEQDNNLSNGAEQIEWMIIDENEDNFLVLSTSALEALPFMETTDKTLSWEESYVRAWLNGEFYENAFSTEEKAKIVTTELQHWYFGSPLDEVWDGDFGYTPIFDDTEEKVFLLSTRESWEAMEEKELTIYEGISDYVKTKRYDKIRKNYTFLWTRFIEGGDVLGYEFTEYDGAWYEDSITDVTACYLVYPAMWISKDEVNGKQTFYTKESDFVTEETSEGIVIKGITNQQYTQVYIPPEINGKKVIGIAADAFKDYTKLVRIKIPENVKWIDDKAFSGCKNLKEIFFPSTLEELTQTLLCSLPALEYINYSEEFNETNIRAVRNYKNREIWEIINTDTGRYGAWDLTYREFIDLYYSIGTENDLFIKMLKEKGPSHTEEHMYYDYDGIPNLNITFESITAEKIYALHYAPFNYNSEDLFSGNYGKDRIEAYLDHGGVCGILTETYHHFIREILGETKWTYCEYGSAEPNHAALLVKTEDGKVLQIDNGGADSWWLGLEFTPNVNLKLIVRVHCTGIALVCFMILTGVQIDGI